MSLADKLKSKKPAEKIVEIDGDKYLLRRLKTSQMVEIVSQNRDKEKADFEMQASILAASVFDPETSMQVMPDPSDWDLPYDVTQKFLDELTKLGTSIPSSEGSEKK